MSAAPHSIVVVFEDGVFLTLCIGDANTNAETAARDVINARRAHGAAKGSTLAAYRYFLSSADPLVFEAPVTPATGAEP